MSKTLISSDIDFDAQANTPDFCGCRTRSIVVLTGAF